MYIKILVYIIDNQQVKYKISIIFFRLADRLPFFVDGGAGPIKGNPAGPISGRWSVPHPISNKRQPSPNRVSSQTHLYVTVTNNRQNAVRVLILTSLNVTDIQSLINRYGTTVVRSSKIYEYYDTANNIMIGFVEDKLPGQAYYAYMLDNELRTGVGDFTIV